MKKPALIALLLFTLGLAKGYASIYVLLNYSHVAGCTNNKGALGVYGTGGTGSYTYHWNTGSTNDTIFNLSAGIYQVTCYSGADSVVQRYTLEEFGVDTPLVHPACYGVNDGFIQLQPYHSAVEPAVFTFTFNGDTLPLGFSGRLDSLSPGVYHWYMVDHAGCADSGAVEVKASSPTLQVIVPDSVLCWGESTLVYYAPPGMSMYYGNDYMGLSSDTFYIMNYFGGFSLPTCAIDTAGCQVCIDNPTIHTQGHPMNITLHQSHDTIFVDYSNYAYDSLNTYYWSGPHGMVTSHYSYLVIDTGGSYFLSRHDEFGCPSSGTYTAYYTGIENVAESESQLSIYPNPATNSIIITTGGQLTGQPINVYDIAGRLVLSVAQQQNTTTLNTAHLAKGAYTIAINNSYKRFVKQ